MHRLTAGPRWLFSSQRMTWRALILVLVLGAAVLATGVAATLAIRQNLAAVRASQEQAFTKAQLAIRSADCRSAQAHLRLAASHWARPALVARAVKALRVCQAFEQITSASDGLVHPDADVTAAVAFLSQQRPAELARKVRSSAHRLLLESPAAKVLSEPVCDHLAELSSTKILGRIGTDQAAPRLYSGCAALWTHLGRTTKRADALAHLRADALAAREDTDWAYVHQAVRVHPAGRSGPGSVALAILNTWRWTVEVTIAGPSPSSSSSQIMAPCNLYICTPRNRATCTSDSELILHVPPGDYTLLLRPAPGGPGYGFPMKARTKLLPGRAYRSCLA